jgi:hypothetical protein
VECLTLLSQLLGQRRYREGTRLLYSRDLFGHACDRGRGLVPEGGQQLVHLPRFAFHVTQGLLDCLYSLAVLVDLVC